MADTSNIYHQSNHQQNLSLLKIYTVYRVLVSIAILLIFLLDPFKNVFFGNHNPELFFYSVSAYLVVNLIALIVVLPKSKQLTNQQLFFSFFLDIVAIVVLMAASGGVRSGLELLLVVTIAASSIMLPRQLALLIASLASLAVLAETISLTTQNVTQNSSFLSAGLLGIILFITSFFIQNLSLRIRGTQLLAEQRAVDVNKLQRLNQQIVQRMRTGILVCSQSGHVLLANNAASELLGDRTLKNLSSLHPQQLPDTLLIKFRIWQATPHYRTPLFRAHLLGPELQASFTAISDDEGADILIFLEDNRRLAQRAQQMKLASLGRLTASIAHEIRNPLGAISHAAQLLNESDQLNLADQRLCDIIRNHSGRMNKVIENVLQLSSRNAANPETINLYRWLQQFIDEFEYIGDTTWSIELQSDGAVHESTLDSSQLNQVVTNLSQNGLRYSQLQTGEAKILFNIHSHPITELPVLDIIDYGAGVGDEAIEHIFEPFYTTDPKGSGLGLFISRELCEANETRLDYILTEQGNSCFRISFPHPDRRLQPE